MGGFSLQVRAPLSEYDQTKLEISCARQARCKFQPISADGKNVGWRWTMNR